MKYIVIVPDGMFDRPVKELGHKTPLEAADTPNMDAMADDGCVAKVKTIPGGFPPGSDIGNMALMGYDPKVSHRGRSPLEAANLGVFLKDDEVAFRCNLVTVVDGVMKDYSAGHISTEEADLLIKALNEKLSNDRIKFYTGTSYRHLLVLKTDDPARLMKIKTVPPHDILNKPAKAHLPSGKSQDILLDLMKASAGILTDHPVNTVRVDLKENPANMIWLWGQGLRPTLPKFRDKFHVDGAVISAVDLVKGIGKLAGLDVINVPGATGYYDTNYLGKAQYALRALENKDFIYIHIEAPDEAGHNGDWKNKTWAIEQIDQHIVGTILNHFRKTGEEARILVCPDHPTPVELRTHSNDPVGCVMWGKGIVKNHKRIYTETTVSESDVAFDSGESLMKFFMGK